MIALRKAFPDSECGLRRNSLQWRGKLSPTALSDAYTVSLTYSLESLPKVRVEKPKLIERDDEELPHVYPDGSLCLFYPRAREFTRRDLLVSTVVPWTSEWLLYYELWHTTGEWLGGGIHPGDVLPDGRDLEE